MYNFILIGYDSEGKEERIEWKVTPIDKEPAFDLHKNDRVRATGSTNGLRFDIKEVWTLTFGAGTLQNEDHRLNFLRFLTAKTIIWKRKYKNTTIETAFEVELDDRFVFEYLQDRRSLKRKTITIVEKEPNYYDNFADFFTRYSQLVLDNALW